MTDVESSPFTPSLLEKETLETLFVQREELANRLVETALDSAESPSKHQQLIVGAPGLGKTHLLSIVHHRLVERKHDLLEIVWLREEEWGVNTFCDLLMRIIEGLKERMFWNDEVESLLDLAPDEAELEAGRLLREKVGRRTLLIFVENLSDLFAGLGDEGRKRFRDYMQTNPFISLMASSRHLFDGITMRGAPFHGVFDIRHLEPLDDDDMALMLSRIARHRGDSVLAAFIQTPTGINRVRAFRHLAGGNHRICALFARHLTHPALERLTTPILETVDDLTPWCRAWVEALPPQPRKIVNRLCRHGSAATVKEIARHCFLKHQAASSQLKVLRDRGIVQATSVGRDSFYELSAPLLRLCIGMKRDRGESLQRMVEFLKAWYEETEQAAEAARAVRSIVERRGTPGEWFQEAMKLREKMREEGVLGILAQAVVRSLAAFESLLVSSEGRRTWHRVWQEVGGKEPELGVGIRLLGAALLCMENPGPRALLSLAVEERKIVEQLLTNGGKVRP